MTGNQQAWRAGIGAVYRGDGACSEALNVLIIGEDGQLQGGCMRRYTCKGLEHFIAMQAHQPAIHVAHGQHGRLW